MGTPGPQKIHRYGVAFKLKAVQMSNQPGVLIKDVAESLCIHPFMLSRWRKEVRDGELVGKAAPIDVTSVALSFGGMDYLHRWTKDGQNEFTPESDSDLARWHDMITINVHET